MSRASDILVAMGEELDSIDVSNENIVSALQIRLTALKIENVTVKSAEIGEDDILVVFSDIEGNQIVVDFVYSAQDGAYAILVDNYGDDDEAIVIDLDTLVPPVMAHPLYKETQLLNLISNGWLNKASMLTILTVGDLYPEDGTLQPTQKTLDAFGNIVELPSESLKISIGKDKGLLVETRVSNGRRRLRLPIVRKRRIEQFQPRQKALIRNAVLAEKTKRRLSF